MDALKIPVADIAAAARVARDTVQVALTGEPVGKRAAERLSKLTKIPAEILRGESEEP